MKKHILFLIFFSFICATINAQSDPILLETRYYTTEQALGKLFPNADKVVSKNIQINIKQKNIIQNRLGWKIHEKEYTLYKAFKNKEISGYAIILDEMGKHYPITFITRISPHYHVDDVMVLVYREPYGDKVRKNRFLKQFKQKTSKNHIRVDDDIDGITGATISSWAMAAGVKKALIIIEELTKEKETVKLN